MGTPSTSSSSPRLRCGDGRRRAGLTLVEVIVAAAMIGLTCSVVMFAFTQLNQMAMVTRLYTGAATEAESQIDLILTDTPFEPQYSGVIPTVLTTGTTSANVTIYQDPISKFTISGTMTTIVSTKNTTYVTGSHNDTLYLYLATVQVTYSYRNRNYSVSLSTTRTSDI
jgi:type II secretory pathway pseudopilin PulG